MKAEVRSPSTVRGSLRPPGDKSISHRALIFNAVAHGRATVENLSPGGDVEATVRCLRALGARVVKSSKDGARVTVHGAGAHGLREPDNLLNAGNSGTTARLLTGLLAAQPFLSVITGDASLRSRPMARIIEPLNRMGAHIVARGSNTRAPMAILGGDLHGIDYSTPVASAQLKSAILLAGLYADGETVVREPSPSRDHTERMLAAMGAEIKAEPTCVSVKGSRLSAVDVGVPGDISGAAFWLVLGVCHPDARVRVEGVGINPTRTGILDVLKDMKADIAIENVREEGGELVADLVASTSSLEGIEVGGGIMPRIMDEIPVLAVAACFARGETVIRDAQDLRVKETDRISAVVSELSKLGARIRELPDGMAIQGTGQLNGGVCRSRGDHRMAMSLAIAGLLARGETVVEGSEAAQVSYPGFWRQLDTLAGKP